MLTVATWNVLAPAYALPSRYAGVAADHLDAATRMPRVREQLSGLLDRCDAVAVQEVDSELAAWLREAAHVVHAPRPFASDGVVLASRSHTLDGSTGTSDDGRRTWAAAEVGGVVVVSVHLDPEWPAKKLHGSTQAAELAGWLGRAEPAVVMGDINASWGSRTGEALRFAGFQAADPGSTAATNGKCRALDVIAARGCAVELEPTGLPPAGTAYWLPDGDVPSDHAPLVATVG